ASFVLNASFSRTVMLIFTLGCAAVYASAIAWKSDLPGSPVVMCHQSTVTGAPPAVDGASLEAVLGASVAAVVAAVVGAGVGAIIAEKGYRRSERASRRSALLEVIFHELESEWALEIVHGVEVAARQHHLAVVITESQGRRIPGRGWIEGILDRRPVGLIVVFS